MTFHSVLVRIKTHGKFNGRVESLPLTNMRYISGWIESIVLRFKAEDFFHNEVKRMKKTGNLVTFSILRN